MPERFLGQDGNLRVKHQRTLFGNVGEIDRFELPDKQYTEV